ncbi:Multidrug resistance-associated protein 4, partial [Coemansia sp. S155-1]
MRNQKIVVLDEATANVDLETDKSIQELISKEFRDCTVLTIAHRLETIMNSDRIIVMDKGTIAEIGTPQELLAKDGMFALLVKTSDFGHSVLTDEHYGAVVEIPEGRAVVFQGIVNVCILSGTVSVCKYSIMPESQWKRVYASSAADLNHQVIPLIVNMQGWLKGLGLDLHYSLCDSVKPTNYVQLYDSGSMPERSDEAWEWLAGNGLVPIINFSGIKACDLCLVR